MKCGYQAGAVCEDATSTVWAAGRDTATQAALCHQPQICHLSLLHHSKLWQTPRLSASPTFHTRWPQTLAPSGPKRHAEVTRARRCQGDAISWLCVGKLVRSLTLRGHTHAPAKMRPVAGIFSAGKRNRISVPLLMFFRKFPMWREFSIFSSLTIYSNNSSRETFLQHKKHRDHFSIPT